MKSRRMFQHKINVTECLLSKGRVVTRKRYAIATFVRDIIEYIEYAPPAKLL
jgi:hypothetical protein